MQLLLQWRKAWIQSSENKRQKKKEMERQRLIPRRISKDLKFNSFVLGRQVGEKSRLCTDTWNKKSNTFTVIEQKALFKTPDILHKLQREPW